MLPIQYTDSYIFIISIVQVSAAHNWNHLKHCIGPLLLRMSISSVEVYKARHSWLEITFIQINTLLVRSVTSVEFHKHQLVRVIMKQGLRNPKMSMEIFSDGLALVPDLFHSVFFNAFWFIIAGERFPARKTRSSDTSLDKRCGYRSLPG
jgi:hypothetical protein